MRMATYGQYRNLSLAEQAEKLPNVVEMIGTPYGFEAKNDPELLKIKEEAEIKEREAKIKSEEEIEKLKIITEKEERERERERKLKRNKQITIIVIGTIGIFALGLILSQKNKK